MTFWQKVTSPARNLFAFFGKLSSSSVTGDPEVMRFTALYGVISISILALVALIVKGVWDPLATGAAFGLTTTGAGGGALAKSMLNKRLEPKEEDAN